MIVFRRQSQSLGAAVVFCQTYCGAPSTARLFQLSVTLSARLLPPAAPGPIVVPRAHNAAESFRSPRADGQFAIEAQQYTGPAPFGNPSAAPYGYGFGAIYLAEIESTGSLKITENPANQSVPAGKSAMLKVVATSPRAITYEWQKAAPGGTAFSDISGATQATHTTPALTVADHGSKFRANLTSGSSKATSGEASINVDGTIPTPPGSPGASI